MDPNHPSPAAAASCLTVRILDSVPVPLSLAEVRKRFLQPCGAARNRIRKRSPRTFLSTGLSTKPARLMHRSDQLLHSRMRLSVDSGRETREGADIPRRRTRLLTCSLYRTPRTGRGP